jgi:hypothetical protein
MEWNGMEWNGMEWNGMEWIGMEWNGMEWNGMEWNGMEWNGMEWNGMESQAFSQNGMCVMAAVSCRNHQSIHPALCCLSVCLSTRDVWLGWFRHGWLSSSSAVNKDSHTNADKARTGDGFELPPHQTQSVVAFSACALLASTVHTRWQMKQWLRLALPPLQKTSNPDSKGFVVCLVHSFSRTN